MAIILKIAVGVALGIILAAALTVVGIFVTSGGSQRDSGDAPSPSAAAPPASADGAGGPEDDATSPSSTSPRATTEQAAPTGASETTKRRAIRGKPALTACDANIRVRPATTTCGFAQNVFLSYWLGQEEPGAFADLPGIPAYSAATSTTYYVRCADEGNRVECRSDDGAYLQFPYSAVAVYTEDNAYSYAEAHNTGDVDPASVLGGEASGSAPASADCDPNYEGQCLDPRSLDYDCAGGSGDGPDYTETVYVVGDDPYDLDRDGDGVACDP